MGLLIFFRGVQPHLKEGSLAAGATLSGSRGRTFVESGTLSADTQVSASRTDTVVVVAQERLPGISYQVAFASTPLSSNPAWVNLDTRLRDLSVHRGRSYEFSRTETGTSNALVSNRDSALSPENTASPYAPIKSTRPMRAFASWETPYPLFRGITEGFPQDYPNLGYDSVVELQANDLFYGLNSSRFLPGSTTLETAMEGGVAQNTVETITVGSTALPMPQVAPFDIQVAGLTAEWPVENMTVTEVLSATQYSVTRSDVVTYQHPVGAAITTAAVSFGEAFSGERIRQVLERVGFDASWYDLDTGQSLIAPSGDLSGVNPLEHINLIADAEFGRFFVSREGLFTFRDRHSAIVDHLTPVFTFKDGATGATEVTFKLAGSLEHTEEKLYNRVKITITGGAYDGQIVDVSDSASIGEHFERVFERAYPYANINDAVSAAQFVLSHNSESQLRLPGIIVQGIREPVKLWPLLLAREIGDRVRFRYQPRGGGDEIDTELIIEGIAHQRTPSDHVITFQCTEAPSTAYWILGRAGFTELGTTTRLGF